MISERDVRKRSKEETGSAVSSLSFTPRIGAVAKVGRVAVRLVASVRTIASPRRPCRKRASELAIVYHSNAAILEDI